MGWHQIPYGGTFLASSPTIARPGMRLASLMGIRTIFTFMTHDFHRGLVEDRPDAKPAGRASLPRSGAYPQSLCDASCRAVETAECWQCEALN